MIELTEAQADQAVAIKRENRELRKHLKAITDQVMFFLAHYDAEHEGDRRLPNGRRLAQMANGLEFANDEARHFGLGLDLRKDAKVKEKVRATAAQVRANVQRPAPVVNGSRQASERITDRRA